MKRNIILETKSVFTLVSLLVSTFFVPTLVRAEAPSGLSFLQSCALAVSPQESVRLVKKENPDIKKFVDELNSNVIGQEKAIDQFAEVIEMMMAMLNDPNKPMARLLFVGPTGVGKTELVLSLVRYFGGNADVHILRINGGELQQDHELSRITGTTAGYEGMDKIPLLHKDNIAKVTLTFKLPNGQSVEFAIVLMDEIEKSGEAAFKMALGLLDEGKVTLGDNSVTMLRKSMIIGTSNEGAADVNALVDSREREIKAKKEAGTALTREEEDVTGRIDEKFRKQIFDTYLGALKRRFAPEFLNRWHAIVQFLHLGKEELLKISEISLAKVQKRVFERGLYKVAFELTPNAKQWLVDKGTDFKNGARELNSSIERYLTREIARHTINNELAEGDYVLVDIENDAPTFTVYARGMSRERLLEVADKIYPGKKMLKAKFEPPAGQPLDDSSMVLKSMAKDLQDLNGSQGAQHLWKKSDLSEPIPRQKLLKDSVSGKDRSVDTMVKYIEVDGLYLRLELNLSAPSTEDRSDPLFRGPRISVDVVSEIPKEHLPKYSDGKIEKFSLSGIAAIIDVIRAKPR